MRISELPTKGYLCIMYSNLNQLVQFSTRFAKRVTDILFESFHKSRNLRRMFSQVDIFLM